ncbi:unnamed protein product [Sphagnum balticum]
MRLSQEENSENVAAKREFYVQKLHDNTLSPVTYSSMARSSSKRDKKGMHKAKKKKKEKKEKKTQQQQSESTCVSEAQWMMQILPTDSKPLTTVPISGSPENNNENSQETNHEVNGSIKTRMSSKGSSDKASAQDMETSPNKDEKYTQTSGLMFADSPSKSSSPEKTQLDDVSSVSLSPQLEEAEGEEEAQQHPRRKKSSTYIKSSNVFSDSSSLMSPPGFETLCLTFTAPIVHCKEEAMWESWFNECSTETLQSSETQYKSNTAIPKLRKKGNSARERIKEAMPLSKMRVQPAVGTASMKIRSRTMPRLARRQGSGSRLPIADRLNNLQRQRIEFRTQSRKEIEKKELNECSFWPQINLSSVYLDMCRMRQPLEQRLQELMKKKDEKIARAKAQEAQNQGLTFKPELNPRSIKLLKQVY